MSMFEDVWHGLVKDLVQHEHTQERRGFETREMLNVSRTWDARSSLLAHEGRNVSLGFAKAEASAILTGRNDVASLKQHAPSIERFSDNGIVFTGAYGPHWVAQRQYIIDTLVADEYTRQAVLTIWQPRPSASVDIPCTVSWQFMVVEERLDMFICMRSSDVWLGLPYDAFVWACILQSLAIDLGIKMGNIHYHAATCHLYARNFESARSVAATDTPAQRWLPSFNNHDSLAAWLK